MLEILKRKSGMKEESENQVQRTYPHENNDGWPDLESENFDSDENNVEVEKTQTQRNPFEKRLGVSRTDQTLYKSKIQKFFDRNKPFEGFRINDLGVTSFKFFHDHKRDIIYINVFLQNPGMMIGKEGKTIAELENYLEEDLPIKINAQKSDVWK